MTNETAKAIDELWLNQLEKDDRTSPSEYPDMALITFEEFRDAMLHAAELAKEQDENAALRERVAATDELMRLVIFEALETQGNMRDEAAALRERVAVLEGALKPLLEQWSAFNDSQYGNQEDAYYKLAKYARPHWEAAARALTSAAPIEETE